MGLGSWMVSSGLVVKITSKQPRPLKLASQINQQSPHRLSIFHRIPSIYGRTKEIRRGKGHLRMDNPH
uniref:Uncharacterized protein n=1 Tax=Kalanchoe fedtschenkoi TaxID=63787 RepID=A0A7N0ZU76_KALFE